MIEDLLGLNIRGLQSVGVIWANPKRYFAAAKTQNWNDQYTPSIRLWLSFFALFSALRFWWIGSSDGIIGAYADGFEEAGLQLPEGTTYQDIGTEAVLLVFGLAPILQIITMLLLSLIYTLWGERTTITLRQRYLFAVIVPSASLMPVIFTIMVFVPQSMVTVFGILLAAVAFLVDFQAGYRGTFSKVSTFGRAWRAALLAAIVVALNTMTSIAAQIAGIVYTAQKYGVISPG